MALPLLLFAGLILLWLATELAILAAPVWLALPLAVAGGVVIGMLFIVGNDAGHNSFTRNRLVNQIVGRIAFLPWAHAFSLWDLSHNRTHHRYNNIAGIDYVWEPMTPEAFRTASPLRRALYAFHRSPVGVPFYYLTELWARRLFLPLPGAVPRTRPVHWFDAALVAGFLLLWLGAATAVGGAFGKTPVVSVLLAVIIPFLLWNGMMSFIIFLHHTHPSIPWFTDEASWTEARGAVSGTTHVRFAKPFRWIVLNIMDHNAHHLASGVPLYHLQRMQRAMEADGGVGFQLARLHADLRPLQALRLRRRALAGIRRRGGLTGADRCPFWQPGIPNAHRRIRRRQETRWRLRQHAKITAPSRGGLVTSSWPGRAGP